MIPYLSPWRLELATHIGTDTQSPLEPKKYATKISLFKPIGLYPFHILAQNFKPYAKFTQ